MPMDREDYEKLLADLNNPELEHSKRTDILTQLRGDYNTVLEDHDKFTKQVEALQKDNSDLVLSNSKLFRMQSITAPEDKKKEEEKNFSETITLEQLENGAK